MAGENLWDYYFLNSFSLFHSSSFLLLAFCFQQWQTFHHVLFPPPRPPPADPLRSLLDLNLTDVGHNRYTASFAFFEAIWEAGIEFCFVNLGSDHPSIIEAMVKGQNEKKEKFPRIITCPNEVCSTPPTPKEVSRTSS